MVKDKREPMLILKGKDINLVIDALESMKDLEKDGAYGGKVGYEALWNKIIEVMRLD